MGEMVDRVARVISEHRMRRTRRKVRILRSDISCAKDIMAAMREPTAEMWRIGFGGSWFFLMGNLDTLDPDE